MQNDITTAIAATQGSTPPKGASTPILDFLGLILPQEGIRVYVRIKNGKVVSQGYAATNEELIEAIESTSEGTNVYHACAVYNERGNRRGENALSVKCFWLDIDCGEGKPYTDADAAVTAVDEFANKLDIPLPLIVRSGRGIHAYWLLTEPVPAVQWTQTARLFKQVTEVLGLHADPSRTADVASILRPPGTVNTKNGAIVFVDGIEKDIEFMTHESFAAALQPYAATTAAVSASIISQSVEQPAQSLLNTNLLGGLTGNYSMTQGYPDGQRTAQLLSRAGHLFAIGCSYEETLSQCRAWNQYNTPPKDDARLVRDVQGIYKKDTVQRKTLRLAQSTLSTVSVPTEWPQPQKITHELLPVASLPVELIPEPYRPWIADITHRMQCPPDFATVAAIIETGTIIGTECGIRPKQNDDWVEVPNLWGAMIAPPSRAMKSPILREITKPLGFLEAEAQGEYEAKLNQYEVDIEVHKATRAAIKTSFSDGKRKPLKGTVPVSADELKSQLAALSPPAEPTLRRYRTNDSSVEKLGELLQQNPRGMLVLRDEIVGLISTWDKEGKENDRAFYLEGWNGKGSYTTDRIGRGTIRIPNMCISLFGGIQPGKLINYLYSARKENDGLLQRFQLMVYPDMIGAWELIDQRPDKAARNRAHEIMQKLAKMNFMEYGAGTDEDSPVPYLRFSQEAQPIFNNWLVRLEREKIRGNDEPLLVEHLAKYRKLMPALALIFHLINVADGKAKGPVSAQAAELAVAWCDYLESHARRVYGLASSLAMQAAASLSRRIARGEVEDRFTLRDIHRHQWSMLTDKEIVQMACDILVGKGWLHEIETPSRFQQKGKTEYLINPKARGFYE